MSQENPYQRHYASLSVNDLLEARDAYHVHLTHLRHVVATAIGRYRIRASDPDAKAYEAASEASKRRGSDTPRTLANSVVRPWSWPCVLVFVDQWATQSELSSHRDDLVPPFLYLPDGRVVPTCVVYAPRVQTVPEEPRRLAFSSQVIGGGYPIITEVQGREHVASIGCLVTDGDTYYALTNQHVTGRAGRDVYSVVRGKRVRIGEATEAALRKRPFESIYPSLKGTRTECNLDVGLIQVDDLARWSAQVYGLGRLGQLVDFNSDSASLDWIGCPLVAHGAASGPLKGEVQALFYRYRSLGGTDYVSDFLIGGRDGQPLPTRPGDSGTVWCMESAEDSPRAPTAQFRPLALQWGGQQLDSGGRVTPFALATSLAVACRELDVDLVTSWNDGLPQYWGAVGHYKIAQLAIAQVRDPSLRAFLQANLRSISYSEKDITEESVSRDASAFVPLADVPDIVWKPNVNKTGIGVRHQENWNHYADMDLPGTDGRTLDDLCGTPVKLDVDEWITFYRSAPPPKAAKSRGGTGKRGNEMGALPFRTWQIFDAMTAARAKGDAAAFLASAGILSHYVGDACQPLHSSMHSDGLDGASTGVHGAYEEQMVDAFPAELANALEEALSSTSSALPRVRTGHDAGAAVVELTRRVHRQLPPERICETYDGLGGHGRNANQSVIRGLWAALGKDTVACIADGVRTLAAIWESAYATTSGGDFAGEVPTESLRALYLKDEFLPSRHLEHLKEVGFPERAPASAAKVLSMKASEKRRQPADPPAAPATKKRTKKTTRRTSSPRGGSAR